ncbi:MAG: M56 family metallopeptidase [Candidatus Korobacteraceae bacterium]
MLNSAAVGMILACVVWTLLRLVRRQNSGTRFVVWFMALLAIVMLPFFAGSNFGASHSPLNAHTNLHSEIIFPGYWSIVLFGAWAIGAGLLLLRLSVGLWHVYRLRNNCREVNFTYLDPAIAGTFRDFAARCRTKLCVSKQLTAPAAIGFFRPAIVFPAWLLPQLSAAEIQVILFHEHAHLRRWDQWSNLAQKIITALFFFHPAVWWIDNRLTLEREMACDDIVLAQTASPRNYASFLISFAEKLQNARGLALAQALVSRMHQMSARVAQILDAKRSDRTKLWKPLLGVSAGLLTVVFGAAPYAPRLVAFQNLPSFNQSRPHTSKKNEAQTAAIGVTQGLMSPTVAASAARGMVVEARPTATLAAFNPRAVEVPSRFHATPQAKPVVVRAKSTPRKFPGQETFVILQTTEYDSSGSGVWTLSLWRVEGGKLAERQLESAIVLSI